MAAGRVSLGVDLGTTNTAAALFDGDEVTLVRTADGQQLTPSVVRIDGKGRVTVGTKARKAFERDPENTRSEFKRLMGTAAGIAFPASGVTRRPEELSAEVLRSVREDVREQAGFLPERAVISVPALFELPQASATSEAARLAGFEKVELLQEPVASALAAGWTQEDSAGSWMVYDLGGGTFDASLLETRDGLLRVVGHDGDNFLGGRDLDLAVVGWVLDQLARDGTRVDRADPANALFLRQLRAVAEDAKIALSRGTSAELQLSSPVAEVDLVLDRATLEGLLAPLVDRSLAVCRRLLVRHGQPADGLGRVVLVGGPTVIPFLRRRVSEGLGAPFADQVDPMTVVARGAALYAATAGLDARPAAAAPAAKGRRLWLQAPAMSSDLTPFVAGRVLDGPEDAPTEVRFVREGWASEWARVQAEGTFLALLELLPRRPNVFRLEGRAGERPVDLLPTELTVVQGMTLSDPPLSRSVGVALANDEVRTYLERGTPLPAKRTFVLQNVETLVPGDRVGALVIPIVQGEYPEAHLCRLVGRLEVRAADLRQVLPSGADLEITVEVDRSGRLTARALVERTGQVFEQVARLVVPEADPGVVAEQRQSLLDRVRAARRGATAEVNDRLHEVEFLLADAEAAIGDARGGDADAAQRARRMVLDADAMLEELEEAARWPEIEFRAMQSVATAGHWVSRFGTPQEQRMLGEATAAVERARAARRPQELERHLGIVSGLLSSAYYRDPDAWQREFDHTSSRIERARDLPRAQQLVREGRAARGDPEKLRTILGELRALLPRDDRAEGGGGGHGSGVR